MERCSPVQREDDHISFSFYDQQSDACVLLTREDCYT